MWPPLVEQWRSWLEDSAPDLPVERLLAWINHESGGNPCSWGNPPTASGHVVETGIGQLYFENASTHAWGTTSSALRTACSTRSQSPTRALTDDEKQLQVDAFTTYVRHELDVSQGQLDAIGADWDAGDLWNLVKLQHALPGIPKSFLPWAESQLGRAPTWIEFRELVTGLSRSELAAVDAAVARYAPLDRLFDNAEIVGSNVGSSSERGSAELWLLLALLGAAFAFTRFV